MTGPATEAVGPATEPYPRFSDAEMMRRTAALEATMAEHELDHVVAYGVRANGSAVSWLSRWPLSQEALFIHTRGERDALLVNFYNHLPLATRIATEADVGWLGDDPEENAVAELRRRGAAGSRIGIMGPVGYRLHAAIAGLASEVVDLNRQYWRMRLVKSSEEAEWVRVAAAMTDDAVRALQEHAGPGVSERELGDIVERTYISRGGTTNIHYFGSGPMDSAAVSVPAQYPSTRRLQSGDAMSCEISATFWDYTAQVLRTFAVDAEPTPLYRELHEVADAAFDAIVGRLRAGVTAEELVEASELIDSAGYTIRDDLIHGYVGGYWPPILRTRNSTLTPVPDFTYEENMFVVVQPNVVTMDETAGVQTGELMRITADGVEHVHDVPRGFLRLG